MSAITTSVRDDLPSRMECVKPYASYQTLDRPVDSFGIYFLCSVEGDPLDFGDDTADIHWISVDELRMLIARNRFSSIDLPAALMFLRDCEKQLVSL